MTHPERGNTWARASGPMCVGCSRMLYRPSNAPAARTVTFESSFDLGTPRPRTPHSITSDAPDKTSPDDMRSFDGEPWRAPNQVATVPTRLRPIAGARDNHRRCASARLRTSSLRPPARTLESPRVSKREIRVRAVGITPGFSRGGSRGTRRRRLQAHVMPPVLHHGIVRATRKPTPSRV